MRTKAKILLRSIPSELRLQFEDIRDELVQHGIYLGIYSKEESKKASENYFKKLQTKKFLALEKSKAKERTTQNNV